MYYVWVLKDKLAVSPMPRLSDIPGLAKVFNGVVVLIEPHEAMGYIDHYLDTWRSFGVEVYYAPTPDYHPLELLDLYNVVKWIDEKIKSGVKILVHCMGGIGRSGLVAASYLLYTEWDPVKTITYIRKIRPGALESLGQEIMFHDFYNLIRLIDEKLFDEYLEIIKREKNQWLHVSKTIQFILEIGEELNLLDKIPVETIYASILHHVSLEEIRSRGLEIDHRTLDILKEYWEGREKLETLMLTLGHTLDPYIDGRVIVTTIERFGDESLITLYCRDDCNDIIGGSTRVLDRLSRIIGYRFRIVQQPYM